MVSLFAVTLLLAQIAPAATGSISGRILERNGEPAANIRVAAVLVPETPDSPTGTSLLSITLTDAAGRYRLENVPAGRYYIAVGRVEYPTYYPGVAALKDAGVVAFRDGDHLDAFDFKMVLPQTLKVSGRINLQSAATARVLVRLRSPGFMLTPTSMGADGSFEFSDVSPGEYELQTTAALPILKITVVDKDITGLEIGTRPATDR